MKSKEEIIQEIKRCNLAMHNAEDRSDESEFWRGNIAALEWALEE